MSNVMWMMRDATSVELGPLGIASWAKSVPWNPRVIVCSKETISNGKAKGKVNAASVDLLLVKGLKDD